MLAIDLVVKLNFPPIPYRLLSKPWILLLLIGYFYYHNTSRFNKKQALMLIALVSFFIGDILIINHENIVFIGLGLFFFSIGKIFFCLKFSHKHDFKVSRLIPFTLAIFAYVIFLIGYLFDSLENFLIPALISFFLTMLMFQFAYLRKGVFNKKSYSNVIIGIILYTLSEGLMAIKTFKTDLIFQDLLIMMFYGTGMYFIVYGVVREKEIVQDYTNLVEQEI